MHPANASSSRQPVDPRTTQPQSPQTAASLESGNRIPEYLPGFAEVAAFVSLDRDGGLYHRFRTLSARNILCMQGEIATLADRLEGLDDLDSRELRIQGHSDMKKQDEISRCSRDWDFFARLSSKVDGPERERMSLIRELRPLLREYCVCDTFFASALILQA
jgi:hypothetical protein